MSRKLHLSSVGQTNTQKICYNDLINDLASGSKPKNTWKIGVELEQFTFHAQTKAPLPYEGEPSTLMFLSYLAEHNDWTRVTENNKLIALKKNGINITLEPGGQFEYSGSPVDSLAESVAEIDTFYAEINAAAQACGIGLMSKGLHPNWSRDDIHWMPKGRYKIMRAYMQEKGQHGLDMMTRSCGTQLNLDYAHEEDMVKKFRVCLALQPFIVALMANSSHLDGQDTGYQSYRSFVWTDTDPDRCGGVPFVFDADMSFAKYVDYALDVPMYFVLRDGEYLNTAGLSFRDFMKGTLPGYEGEYPTLSDWHDHLSTLFPEVRLKKYLELRGADSNRLEMVHAMTAFWVGALYDEDSLNILHDRVMAWPKGTYEALGPAMAKDGLKSDADLGVDVMEMVDMMLDVSAQGLYNLYPEAPYMSELLSPFRQKMTE